MIQASPRRHLSLLLTIAWCAALVSARPLVRSIKSANEFDRVIAKHAKETGLPVIADFYSDGCGPCRMMAPVFKRLAQEHENKAVFIKIDTNRVHEVSSRYAVRSIPTFIAFVNGRKVDEFSGAGEGQLRQMTDRAVDRSEYENVRLEAESLLEYYRTKDASKSPESVEGVLKKCADMTTKGNPDKECVGAAAQKLAKNLRKKYKDAPKLTKRFSDEQRRGSSPAGGADNKESSSSSSSSAKSGRTDKPNLHLASVDDLREELERRLEAERDAKEEEEEEEDAHGWTRSDFPERVTIVGGGPAGMSAAIYAARAGLEPVVVAPPMGGQLQGKGVDVENYPGTGAEGVTGPAIVAAMRDQAASFGARFLADTVREIDVTKRPLRITTNSTNEVVETHAVIVATGAESNWLGVEGEYEMRGGGVSTCATCDGHFYKDTDVVVVGGGDTAMEDALVLARTSKHVTVVHRRDTFRASKVLAERVMNHPSISVRWNTTVQQILGESVGVADSAASSDDDDDEVTTDLDAVDAGKKVVTGVVLESKSDDATTVLPCQAVFVAIGHTPTTSFLEGVVEFDPDHAGYLRTYERSTRTSVEGVFAAGDVADPVYRQAVTSAGSGAAAALDAERWLSESDLGNEAAEFEAELLRELLSETTTTTSAASDGANVYDDAHARTKGYREEL